MQRNQSRPTIFALVTAALAVGMGTSCLETRPNTEHCVYNGGNAACVDRYPGSREFCSWGTSECGSTPDGDGCVAARPEDECYSPCGDLLVQEDASCLGGDESSSGGASSTGDVETESGSESTDSGSSDGGSTSTTGDVPCMGNEDCTDDTAPFCDAQGECVDCGGLVDGDAACAEVDPERPVCDAGVCVPCNEQNPGACGGQTPVCGEDNLCRACEEHSECPGSACHLDGPQVGACFDLADVVEAGDTAELQSRFASTGAGNDVVIMLTGLNYGGAAIDFTAAAEVAVIGDGSPTIAGNRPGGLVATGGSAIVYFAGLTLASNSTGDGLECSGTSVWLDDSEVRNNTQIGMDVSGGCEAHLRRTVVRANNGGGVVLNGASLAATTSVISSNLGANPGIQAFNSTFEVTYSTIVGNFASGATPDTLQCLNSTGFVRNSIVRGETTSSISGCGGGGIAWSSNSVDTAGLGASNSNDGAWLSTWFAMPDAGNYRLTTSGETEFANKAMWQVGDPLVDIDGQSIPTAMPSFPGYDQP